LGGPTSKGREGGDGRGRDGRAGIGKGHEPPPQYLEEVYAYDYSEYHLLPTQSNTRFIIWVLNPVLN